MKLKKLKLLKKSSLKTNLRRPMDHRLKHLQLFLKLVFFLIFDSPVGFQLKQKAEKLIFFKKKFINSN